MVLYQVQFKPINEFTKKAITNMGEWTGTGLRPPALTTNPTDCILAYEGNNGNRPEHDEINVSNFKKVPHEIWAVYANADSVKNAMKLAKPLISQYGAQNVQICKIAPSSIEIVFEEAQ